MYYYSRPPGLAAAIIALSWCCFALLSAAAAADHVITYQPEVSVLRAVKQQLKDPSNLLANWGRNSDPCQSNWTAVICLLYPDGYLHVQELRFLGMNLSGSLAPELGQLNHTTILDFMWNNISGGIPREIGNMTSLQLLLLSGNQISGPLPDELGYLPNLTKFQLDLNNISGSLPRSFANLKKAKHFHMNNNSISGQIPPELSLLPALVHFLLDNNNLSGYLPSELYKMPSLAILQLNNNNFNGTEIPESYGQMSKLLKLSLRNCGLQGSIPDLSSIPGLLYLDLSGNQLNGTIPASKLSNNITTIDLSNNSLIGSIPGSFSGLPNLQKLSLAHNTLTGTVPSTIWQNLTFKANATLTLDFRNNYLSNISGILNPPSNVSIKLQGNPICTSGDQQNISQFCGPTNADTEAPGNFDDSTITCSPQACATSEYFECVQASPGRGFCALPLLVEMRLRSPSFSDFGPYMGPFEVYITFNLGLDLYQLKISSFTWEEGPRLNIDLKIFPQYSDTTQMFNSSEIQRLVNLIATFSLPSSDLFGPYDLLDFEFLGFYRSVFNIEESRSGMNIGALLGIVLGTVSCTISVSLIVAFVFYVKHKRHHHEVSRGHRRFLLPIRIEGVKEFSFVELETATTGFHISTEIGHGSYGNVYKGVLADGTFVAIKRAQQGSLQCQPEFLTEIEFLSRLHHRNLVTLVGYCYEEGEQMLVYEFMPNGSLHSLLSARFREPLSFSTRLYIALGSAKGLLYLHTEADPPIIHRDVKANNILLDSKFTAKVSDFGISRLAPIQDGEGVATPISTVVKGTPGYLDPEYFLTHKLTEKSDVYSLGIVFLELLTGMKPISHGKNIVREVYAACESGMMFSIIDQRMGHIPSECTKRFMELALKCCQDATEGRPSMLDVVRELENITSMIPKAETISSSEPYASTSQISGGGSTFQVSMSASLESSDFPGSDLISGVIPTIRPR